MPQSPRPIFFWIIASLVLLLAAPALAQQQAVFPPSTKGGPVPQPGEILQKMCDFLKSHPAFAYKAEVSDDQVFQGGKKLQFAIDMETWVRRPDRLRVNAEGDLLDKQFFFDGRSITLYDQDHNVFGTMEVPPDIDSALAKARKDFGLRVALTELASPQLCQHIKQKSKHALYVGLGKVHGVSCHHLAFDSDEVHLQIWVEPGDRPVPRKMVFTEKKVPGTPQWIAYLNEWKFPPQIPDSQFVFTPPQGAEKIKFVPVPVEKTPAPEPKKKGAKP